MLVLKACPRCRGDLSLESEDLCTYLECLQCGHILSLEQEKALGVRASKRGLVHIRPVARVDSLAQATR